MTPFPESPVSSATLPVDDTITRLQTANYYFRVALDQIPEAIVILQPESSDSTGPKVIYSNAPCGLPRRSRARPWPPRHGLARPWSRR